MDIKDYILIGGGLLIAAVVVHGFWIAWRGRQEPLRIDIQPDLIPDAVSDIERLRGELPNGGARIVNGGGAEGRKYAEARQEPLPLLLEPSEGPGDELQRSSSRVTRRTSTAANRRQDREPTFEFGGQTGARSEPRTEPLLDMPESSRAKVTDVAMPEQPIVTEKTRDSHSRKVERRGEVTSRKVESRVERKTPERAAEKTQPSQEIIVMNVMAPGGEPYTGDAIFAVLRAKGLKFGEMNIFHRVDPMTKAVHYSIANVVEPGTFDMADMEAFRAPGLCMFMQLPGPEHPAAAFEDMLDVAGEITARLGGEISDEQRNRVTRQTVEHYRQRIADFSRRRMSKRA